MSEAPDAQGDADENDGAEDAASGAGPEDETTEDETAEEATAETGTEQAEEGEEGETVGTSPESAGETDVEALRRQVEEEYDFDDFGPADMAEMSPEEWDAAFDPDTWITGEALLDRVEADLKQRVADRDVFARVERADDRVLAYSDTGYATIYGDGSVEGHGTVLRDVKPTVALCSMESYDVPADPPDDLLPEPQEVPEGSGTLGNWMLQAVAATQVLAGLALFGAWVLVGLDLVDPPGGGTVRSFNVFAMLLAGVLFVAIGVVLFTVVANARLSDRFRAEEYRNRLRAVDLEPGERPEFLPDGTAASDDPVDDVTDERPGDDRRTDDVADGRTGDEGQTGDEQTDADGRSGDDGRTGTDERTNVEDRTDDASS